MCHFAASAHLITSKTRTLRRLAPADRKLVFAALALLTVVKIALWMLSFQHVTRFVKIPNRPRPVHRSFTPQQVVWAVQLASRYVPRATCLPQALTTQILLSWHGHLSRLHIGVMVVAQKFEAHAWVECDGRVVIGEAEEIERYTPILAIDTGPLKN
jgi:Transglutaminase-like superfamily